MLVIKTLECKISDFLLLLATLQYLIISKKLMISCHTNFIIPTSLILNNVSLYWTFSQKACFAINISFLSFPLLKVTAFDADSKENGEIQYHKINGGSEFIDSVEVDMNNGNIFLVSNKGLDRETTESQYKYDYK